MTLYSSCVFSGVGDLVKHQSTFPCMHVNYSVAVMCLALGSQEHVWVDNTRSQLFPSVGDPAEGTNPLLYLCMLITLSSGRPSQVPTDK